MRASGACRWKYYPEGRGATFEADYAAAGFNDPYESFGPMAYAAGQVYVQAVARVKEKGGITREAVLQELESGTFQTLIGDFGFDDNGMLDILHIGIFRVDDGRWNLLHKNRSGRDQARQGGLIPCIEAVSPPLRLASAAGGQRGRLEELGSVDGCP